MQSKNSYKIDICEIPTRIYESYVEQQKMKKKTTMRLNTNFFRIRLTMVFAPLLTIFFIYVSFKMILPDYLATTQELVCEYGIIQSVYPNIETHKQFLKSDTHQTCIDIELKNKSYIIRLTDKLEEDKWLVINDNLNKNKTIEFKYLPHLLHDKILYNPNELSIDNKIIIHFSDSKRFILWLLIGACLASLLFGFISFLAIKTYVVEFLTIDRVTYKKGVWKLIRVWINDWTNT